MAIVIRGHGAPAEVARVEEIELSPPQPHEAVVRLLAAPINPADLNMIEGSYPIRPPLPAVPGGEGAGVVMEVGGAVQRVKPGDLVLLPPGVGTWREAVVVAAEDLVPVPSGIAPEQAAMLRVNPATALRLLRDFVPLGVGDWVLQNAANSGVGRAVIQIAQHLGFRTVNVVRRKQALEDLADLHSARSECLEESDLPMRLPELLEGAPLRLALNAVGGQSALGLANALSPGGTLVTYGAMARQPLRLPNGLLIFRDLRFRGFWVTHWFQHATAADRAAMLAELFDLAQRGVIRAKIERTYRLAAATEALAHAGRGGRSGKIVFGMDETRPTA